MNLAKLLLSFDVKVNTLAVGDVAICSRRELTRRQACLQVRRIHGGVLSNVTIHIRIEVSNLSREQPVEERTAQ